MKPVWRRFVPIALYVAVAALLVAAGFFIVQQEWNRAVQISLGVAVIALAIYAALEPARVRAIFTGKKAKYGSNVLILIVAFLGILVVVNYLGYANPQRWDLTEDKENTLTPETIEVLASLTEPVKVTAFFTPELSSATAEELLDQYEFNSNGKFTYEFIDPVNEPAIANAAGITKNGTLLFTMGENKEMVITVTEKELTSALIRLKNPGGRMIYFLTGHGEFSIEGGAEDSFTQLVAALTAKNYAVKSLNLLAEARIPEDANVLVIARPLQPVAAEEITLLDEFLKSGGAMIVLEEPTILTQFGDREDPLAQYLAETYGVVYGNDVVVDTYAAQLYNQPFIAIAAEYGDHAIADNMGDMATFFPTSRSVTITEPPSATISQVGLIFTTEQAFAETDMASLEDNTWDFDEGVDPVGPISLAVVVEDTATQARIVVFGDAEFPVNANYAVYGNGTMMVNAIDWAAGQEDLINLSTGTTTERYLDVNNPYMLGFILLGSLVVIPGIVIAGGIASWIQRRRRG